MKLSIIVPCHNEQAGLRHFHQELTAVLDAGMPSQAELEQEILLVDDGSADDTWEQIDALSQQDARVQGLKLSRNFGKESAIFAGLQHASGDYVMVMDADLQDPPAMIPQMWEQICTGDYDIVRMRRVSRDGEPKIRSFFSRMFYRIINRISETEIADGARDYQLMTREFTNAILSMHEYNRFFKGMTSWVGFRVKWLEYKNIERAKGETQWSFWSLTRYALDGIMAFSTAPLQFASGAGIFCFFLAIAMIVFVIVRASIFGDPVAGWPSLVCIILLVGGIQLMCVGILGQYLAKTYLETKRRPIYLLETQTLKK